jgi:sugar phosphate isomerase/epimerase
MGAEDMKSTISRRNFVGTSALAALACAASSAKPAAAAGISQAVTGESPIQLGIASYTFRNFSRTQMIAYLKQLKVTGLNTKDVKDHLPTAPDEEAKAVSEYRAAGIQLHGAGVIYFPKDEDDDIRAKFEYCKRAGIPVIIAGDPAIGTLPRIEKFVKEYDMRIAIHNHGPEDPVWPSPLDVLKSLKGMDPRMGCCMDVGHAVRAGADVVEAIHIAGPRLYNVHIKDLTDFKDKESQVAVGDGKMPIRGIFEALMKINYKGWVDLEYEVHGDDPMPGVTSSMAYMRGVLAGMGYASHS